MDSKRFGLGGSIPASDQLDCCYTLARHCAGGAWHHGSQPHPLDVLATGACRLPSWRLRHGGARTRCRCTDTSFFW